jgi:hypothetical protein
MNHPMHGTCIVLVYEDDILIVSNLLKWIELAKRAIGEEFRMKDFGEAKFILGMDIVINREAGTVSLSKEQYTKEILKKYGMLDNTPSKVPMASTHNRGGEVAFDQHKVAFTPSEHETFRVVLGSVNLYACARDPTLHLRSTSSTCGKLLPRNYT